MTMNYLIKSCFSFFLLFLFLNNAIQAQEENNFDPTAKKIAKKDYDLIYGFDNKRAPVMKNGKWGFIDENGNEVIPTTYDLITYFWDVTTAVKKENSWYLIDKKGKTIKNLDIDFFYGFKKGRAKIVKQNRYAYIDINGNLLDGGWKEKPSLASRFFNPSASPVGNCFPNLDFDTENTPQDFSNWTLSTTTRNNDQVACSPTSQRINPLSVNNPPTAIYPNSQLKLRSQLGTFDYYGVELATSSNYFLKLGNDNAEAVCGCPNARGESVEYTVDIPANQEYYFFYDYAAILTEPTNGSHDISCEKPRFTLIIYEKNNPTNILDCGSADYVADPSLLNDGFDNLPIPPRNSSPGKVWFKNWNSTFIKIPAQTTNKSWVFKFITGDCVYTGHWGYAYLDLRCSDKAFKASNTCKIPLQTNLQAPSGFASYNWYNNSTCLPRFLLGSGPSISIPQILTGSPIYLVVTPLAGRVCNDTLSGVVTANNVDFIIDPVTSSLCGRDTVNITGHAPQGSGYTFSWTPTTSIIGTSNTPSIKVNPDSSTKYYVTVSDPSTSCVKKDSIPIVLNNTPKADFTPPSSQCFSLNGNGFNFISSSTINAPDNITQFVWDFDNGTTTISGNNIVQNFAVAGAHSVKLIVESNNHCKDSITKTFSINPKPIVSYTGNTSQCFLNNNFIFTSSSSTNPSSVFNAPRWIFDDRPDQYGQNINITYTDSTILNHNIKLVETTLSGCIDSVTIPINLYPSPNVAVLAPLDTICFGDSMRLQAQILSTNQGAITYQWTLSGLNIPNANDSFLVVHTPGEYQVSITNSNNCSTPSQIKNITVSSLPTDVLNTPNQSFICQGGSTQLSSALGIPGTTYQWYYNNSSISGANGPTYSATMPGIYTLQATSNTGCKLMLPQTINLSSREKPQADFTFPTYCKDLPIIFQNTSMVSNSGPINWHWYFGDGDSSNLYFPQPHTYTGSGPYNVILQANSMDCPALSSQNQQTIQIVEPIQGIRYQTVNTLINTEQTLNARNINNNWLWMPSTGLISSTSIQNPIFKYDQDQEYLIRLGNMSGCNTVDTLLVRVFKNADIQVPTGFSPNGDGHNDYLEIFLIGVKLKRFWVFNRWGQLLFETTDPKQKWDGTFKGKKQPAETYVWQAEVTDNFGINIIKRGQTILIR